MNTPFACRSSLPPLTPDRLALSYREAAKILGVSERTVWTWVKAKLLPAAKLGRTVRIRADAISDFLRQRESTSPELIGQILPRILPSSLQTPAK